MIIAIAMIFTITLTSCTKKACEKNNTGNVKIYNNYSVTITVDVWSDGIAGNDGFAGERVVGAGKSTTYSDIPAGPVEIWEADVYEDWGYWDEYCTQCETYEFEIYKKKSETIGFINNFGLIDKKLKSERK